MNAQPILNRTLSSSGSNLIFVECTHVFVHMCCKRTYDPHGTASSLRVIVVGSSSNIDDIS